MSEATYPSRTPSRGGFRLGVGTLAAAWLSMIVALAVNGVFEAPPGTPPVAVLSAIVVPPLLFAVALRVSGELRRQVLAVDPVWLAAIQGMRVLGVGFLFVYGFGHLPGLFAHPAGWGDLLVAVLAPFVAARLARDPGFLRSPWLWRFHALGMLDFVGAVGSGLLARFTVGGTDALGQLPLVLVPAFAVPLWICLHLAAFEQIRAAAGREGGGAA
jgi:hypothetical protein